MKKPEISILIPFRDTGNRKRQFEWLQRRWAELFPNAEIIVESDDGIDPFSKTIAVNNCYKKSSSDILAIVDADVYFDYNILTLAAEKIRNKKASWVIPCTDVYRLTKKYTENLIEFSPSSPAPVLVEDDYDRITKSVGAVSVFSRKQFEQVGGMDERFRGWGGEDNAWNILLNGIYGEAEIWDNPMYHLWHPRDTDGDGNAIWPGQEERNSSVAKEYFKNKKQKKKLLQIAKENRRRNQWLKKYI